MSVTKGGQKKKQWWPLSNEPIKKFNCSSSLYNIQLLPSYEMNIETCQLKGGCFPEGIHPMRKKITSRGLTTWCSSHMKANTVFYTETTLRCLTTLIFCFVEDNKIISGIVVKHYETGLVKKREFSTRFRLSEAVHRATTYCFPLYYICLGCSPGCLSRQVFFR